MKRPSSAMEADENQIAEEKHDAEPHTPQMKRPAASTTKRARQRKRSSSLKKPSAETVNSGTDSKASPSKLPVANSPAKTPMKTASPSPTEKASVKASRKEKIPETIASTKRGKIVSTEEHPDGWKTLVLQTQTGRKYKKYLAPDGKYFFSVPTAKSHGFKF